MEILQIFTNPNDKTLSDVYGNYEYDDMLGLNGAQVDTTLSSKYVEKDVQNTPLFVMQRG
jgi:hypothetical protein